MSHHVSQLQLLQHLRLRLGTTTLSAELLSNCCTQAHRLHRDANEKEHKIVQQLNNDQENHYASASSVPENMFLCARGMCSTLEIREYV